MSNCLEILKKEQEFFRSNITKDIRFRKEQLKKLVDTIRKYETKILDALYADLKKSAYESYMTEIGIVYEELRYVLKHLDEWAKPKRVKTPLHQFLSFSKVYPEPYGVVLIMSPWNYPFQLTMEPLIGAIAAGNCTVLKPSNYSLQTSNILAKIIAEAFDSRYITTVLGGREANSDLLEQKFDYIFFTGGTEVGKTVMSAAAKHLIPVSLELGGKSPCIVEESAKLDLAARRIVWGKFINAGQTCVAPDYILVHESIKDAFLEKVKHYIEKFFGKTPLLNDNYPKIINKKHYDRLLTLIGSEKILCGGSSDANTNRIEPTVLDNIAWDSPVMQEEIFGPVLPILTYSDLESLIDTLNTKEKPLALYIFSSNRIHIRKVLKNISYGGGCINDTVVHFSSSYLPIGGVGASGIGAYHGKNSFDTFTHYKGILKKSILVDIPLRYPPYGKRLFFLKRFLK